MIHQYKLTGYNIVLDIYSGSVHCVDEVAYDVIAMYEENDKQTVIDAMLAKYGDREDVTAEEIAECYDDVTALKEQGKLFAPDTYRDKAFDFKNRKFF